MIDMRENSSREIEAKMALPDSIRHRLPAAILDLGGIHAASLREHNTFLDRPGTDLRKRDQGLRIRREHNTHGEHQRTVVTFKGPRSESELKSRQEIEFRVDDPDATLAVFLALGFETMLRFEKAREVYRLGDCEVVIDRLPHLGWFVEIEGPDEQTILNLRNRLGLGEQPLIRSSYIAMLSEHLEDHGQGERDLRLD
ncbi:MAG: class IV adenylate cyclase [Phycisphaeraceae bacterium]|nr:class IV adenylate cyclase [Phycisphaeraceae bacterium]